MVEADDLNPSHTFSGNHAVSNPNYDQERQPRQDRGDNAHLLNRVHQIAENPDPRQLVIDTSAADTGSPIIGPETDNFVESGNGRVMGLVAAYRRGKAQSYRDYLTQNAALFGLDAQAIAGFKHPVLVRRRTQELTAAQLKTLIRESNQSSVAGLSPTLQLSLIHI